MQKQTNNNNNNKQQTNKTKQNKQKTKQKQNKKQKREIFCSRRPQTVDPSLPQPKYQKAYRYGNILNCRNMIETFCMSTEMAKYKWRNIKCECNTSIIKTVSVAEKLFKGIEILTYFNHS